MRIARSMMWVAAVVLTAAGCGGGAPYALHPVKGKVSYDDGSKLPGDNRSVIFYNISGGPRSPSSNIEPDGSFELITADPGDGCPAGDYKIVIQCTSSADYATGNLKQLVPAVYTDVKTTPLTAKVPGGNYDIKLSKTAKAGK